jgi:hypothetical protein
MLDEFPRDAWHICWTPSEHPPVLTEELDERAFLCGEREFDTRAVLEGSVIRLKRIYNF